MNDKIRQSIDKAVHKHGLQEKGNKPRAEIKNEDHQSENESQIENQELNQQPLKMETQIDTQGLNEQLSKNELEYDTQVKNDHSLEIEMLLQSPVLEKFTSQDLSEETIQYYYKMLYNQLLETNQGSHDLASKVIISKIQQLNNGQLIDSDKDAIVQILNKARDHEYTLNIFCKKFIHLFDEMNRFISELKSISPSTDLINKLESNFIVKIDQNEYDVVKELINYLIQTGYYNVDAQLEHYLIDLSRKLLTLIPNENAMLSQFVLLNSNIAKPYTLDFINDLRVILDLLNSTCTGDIQNDCQFLFHTCQVTQELLKQAKNTEHLCKISLATVQTKIIKPILDNPKLLGLMPAKSLREFDNNLTVYQKLLRNYGMVRIKSAINPNDIQTTRELQNLTRQVEELSKKFTIFSELQSILDNIKVNDLSKEENDIIQSIKNYLPSIAKKLISLGETVHDLGNEKIDPISIFHFRIGRGDFFHPSDRQNLFHAIYAIPSFLSFEILCNTIFSNYENYTDLQKQECYHFIKMILNQDASNSSLNNIILQFYQNNPILYNEIKALISNYVKAPPPKVKGEVPDINQIITLVAKGNLIENDYNQHLENFVNAIEEGYKQRFAKIDIKDFKINASQQNKETTSFREYMQYHNLICQTISLMLLNNIDPLKNLVARQKLTEVKNIHAFLETAIILALEKGASATAFALDKAISDKQITRLLLSSDENESLRASFLGQNKESCSKLNDLIQEVNGLPFIDSIQTDIVEEFRKKHGSGFEKIVAIGSKLNHINNIIVGLRLDIVPSDLTSRILPIMQQNSFMLKPVMPNDMLVNQDKIAKNLSFASNQIQPTQIEFTNIETLSNHLKSCYEHSIEVSLNDLWVDQVAPSLQLANFAQCLETLDLIRAIEKSNNKEYKNLNRDLFKILEIYEKQISIQLKEDYIDFPQHIENFFVAFDKNDNIKIARNKDISIFNLLSPDKKLKSIIHSLDKDHKRYLKIKQRDKIESSQFAYSQLLEDVLEGSKDASLLPLVPETKTQTSTTSLLPETEFDVPTAEPENPERIGINTTMSFNTVESRKRTVLDLFSTKELIQDFVNSFPWAVQLETISKLQNAQFNSDINLLGSSPILPGKAQTDVIRIVLLSLDILGKLTGFNGDLAIENYSAVKDITNGLRTIVNLLKSPNMNLDEDLNNTIQSMIQNLIALNNQYHEMQQQFEPKLKTQNNPSMNGFCHLNEHLACILTGTTYQASVLAPKLPASPYLEKINQVMKPKGPSV